MLQAFRRGSPLPPPIWILALHRFLAPRSQLAPPPPDFQIFRHPCVMITNTSVYANLFPLSSCEKYMPKMGLLSFVPKHIGRFESTFCQVFRIIYIWSSLSRCPKVVLVIGSVMVSILSKLLQNLASISEFASLLKPTAHRNVAQILRKVVNFSIFSKIFDSQVDLGDVLI